MHATTPHKAATIKLTNADDVIVNKAEKLLTQSWEDAMVLYQGWECVAGSGSQMPIRKCIIKFQYIKFATMKTIAKDIIQPLDKSGIQRS